MVNTDPVGDMTHTENRILVNLFWSERGYESLDFWVERNKTSRNCVDISFLCLGGGRQYVLDQIYIFLGQFLVFLLSPWRRDHFEIGLLCEFIMAHFIKIRINFN